MGPTRRAWWCLPAVIPPAPIMFVEVTAEPRIQGQDVWRVVPSNMWQPEQATIMCAALLGHAATLARAPAALSSSNRLAVSLAMLHCGSRAWCWVIVALKLHSYALRMYHRGGVPYLAIRPADLEDLLLGTRSSDGGTTLFLQGLWWGLRRSGSAETTEETASAWSNLRPWRCGSGCFVAPGELSRAPGRSSPMHGACGWRGSFLGRG